MPSFHLFRVRVERPAQLSLDDPREPTPRLIGKAIEERPVLETGWGHEWHLGNLEVVAPTAYYFKLGKITKRVLDSFDKQRGDFIERELDAAPYTHVLLELEHQVCGIAPNSSIGRTARSIGTRLEGLLNETSFARQFGYRFFVMEIPDPDDFLAQIRNAFAVRGFTFTVNRPNFVDASELAQALESYVEELDGSLGKVSVTGQDLDRTLVEDQTRAAVASGGQASASIERAAGQPRPDKIKIGANPVVVREDEITSTDGKANLIERMVAKFREIRDRAEAE